MKAIDPDDHRLFSRTVDFAQKLSSGGGGGGNAAAEEVISSEFPGLMNGSSLQDFVKAAASDVQADSLSSLRTRIAVARAVASTGVGSGEEAVSLILDSKLNVQGVTVQTCREALAFIDSLGKDGLEGRGNMAALVAAKFPFAKDIL